MFRLLVLTTIVSCALGAYLPRGAHPIPDGRIVGGEETTIDKFPYQLSFRYMGSHRCGASIIQPSWALTAAHCVEGANKIFFRFVAGSSARNSGGESLYVTANPTIHEKYSPTSAQNDIALVRLDGAWTYNNVIQPIALPAAKQAILAGTKALVSGWGTETEQAGSIPVLLRYTEVSIVDFDACGKAYEGQYPLLPGMICAGAPGGGKDACQGDSGGPLASGNKQVGVVSWGLGCARPEYPGVYTDVAYYADWIATKTRGA